MSANATKAYQNTTMTTEEPDLDWIVRGWRGLRVYLQNAATAADANDVPTKLANCDRASKLLTFLEAITPTDDGELGRSLAAIYRGLHLRLVNANAESSSHEFHTIATDLALLEKDVLGSYSGKPNV